MFCIESIIYLFKPYYFFIDFSDILRTYIVKQYGHWAEYKATDKTALRSFLYGRIDSIVELNK